MQKEKNIIAFIGMPGSGKSETVNYLQTKGIQFVRFGDVTQDEVQAQGLSLNPQNERLVREQLRKDFGMAVHAIKSEPKINALLREHDSLALDGLYSWEEYIFLVKKFPSIKLIHIYAEPEIRYTRLSKRIVRPLTAEEARERDFAEIEKLNKGGPIALADYIIVNNTDKEVLYKQIDTLLMRLKI